MSDRISVIVPVHNVEPWIEDCLWSILRQDVDMEIIVVDDRSTDETFSITAKLAEAEPRIRLLSSLGDGSGAARNTGIDAASGEYLAFADGDDLVPDGAYRALLAAIDGAEVAVGDYVTFAARSSWRRNSNLPIYGRKQAITVHDDPRFLRDRVVWNKLFRRSFWDEHGIRFPPARRANDIEPMTRALLAARLHTTPEATYIYRKRPGGTSMTAAGTQLTGLRHYFHEEAKCSALVADNGDAQLAHAYFTFLLSHDVWNHARHALELIDESGTGADDEVAALFDSIHDILTLADIQDWNALEPEKVWRYRLLLRQRSDLISLLPPLDAGVPPRVLTPSEFTALTSELGPDTRHIARGCLEAGIRVVSSHPTPSGLAALRVLLQHLLASDPDLVESEGFDPEAIATIERESVSSLTALRRRMDGETVSLSSIRQHGNSVELTIVARDHHIDGIRLERRRSSDRTQVRISANPNELAHISVGLASIGKAGIWDVFAETRTEDGLLITYPLSFASGVFAPARRRADRLYVLTADENGRRLSIGRKPFAVIRLAGKVMERIRRIARR